jgi:hypothetical protein
VIEGKRITLAAHDSHNPQRSAYFSVGFFILFTASDFVD